MASKIVLHIGLQKSGTTFLQHMLQDNSEALAGSGVLYPVPKDWDDGKRSVANHEWSSYGLLGTEFPWVTQERASRIAPSWDLLLDQVQSWPATVLLSAEALSVVRPDAIRRLLDSLAVGDVEVVITARSLGRSLPSLWQQHIRNGRSTSFETYLGRLAAHRDKGRNHVEADLDAHIWRAFTLSGLVQRWSDAGANRVSVVTSPGKPPELLLERFTQAARLPDLVHVPVADREAHTGLTAPETLVLASLNAAWRDNSRSRQKADRLRQTVTERFQARERRGGKVVIPPEWRSRVADWSRADLTTLQATDARIVGDIGDLRYDPDQEKTAPPTAEETARAGAEAALALADPAVADRLPHDSLVRRRARGLRRLMG
ncbi:hypothetical protein [Actinomadura sp. 7K507]|uniref:hypothetical protein n=1 Tax=Actinomadura sp. 7K507 TaxID=2530365 RepID=UPI001051F601|nr:hypothetical protein [Actinomadura sp. 7K507]TDC81457.1 hypothetical protein E1285_32665 [Actinomadura sp. 7K507]